MDYSQTRYSFNPKRAIVWEEVSRYLHRSLSLPDGTGIELGCGYGDWIGNIDLKKKTAIELNSSLAEYARAHYNLDIRQGDVFDILPTISDASQDLILASNFFEHFELNEVKTLLGETKRLLPPHGRLLVIQPNYRYCAEKYFDDYTHRSIHSHISFCDLLESIGFKINRCIPRFLPFSFKSRLPVNRLLVRAYLYSPIKPLGAQFMICAQP